MQPRASIQAVWRGCEQGMSMDYGRSVSTPYCRQGGPAPSELKKDEGCSAQIPALVTVTPLKFAHNLPETHSTLGLCSYNMVDHNLFSHGLLK